MTTQETQPGSSSASPGPVKRESIKSALKSALTLGSCVTAFSGIALYVYLKAIDRVDLLQPSLSSLHGLAIVLFSILLLTTLIFLTFYSSSILFYVTSNYYASADKVPRRIIRYIIMVHASWNAILATYFLSATRLRHGDGIGSALLLLLYDNLPIIILLLIMASALLSTIFHRRAHARAKWPDISFEQKKRRALYRDNLMQIGLNLLTGATIAYASILGSAGSVIFILMNPSIEKQSIGLAMCAGVLAVTWPGILVGVFYLSEYKRSGDANKSIKRSLFAAIIIGTQICVVLPALTLLPIDIRALQAAAVFSNKAHTYAISDKDTVDTYRLVGFVIPITPPYSFQGYERYHFGDVLVLCVSSFNVLTGQPEENASKKNTKKEDRTSSQLSMPSISPDSGCIDVKKDELRRISIVSR